MMSLWNKGALVMGIKGAYAHGQLKNDYSHHMGTLFTLRLPVKLPAVIQLTILILPDSSGSQRLGSSEGRAQGGQESTDAAGKL